MEKLIKIQQELHAPKDLENKFGGYNYRSAESILENVKPLLDGAIILLTDELVMIGNRYYVKATATFKDGEFEQSVSAYAREEEALKGMTQGQITGATSSYARKYALNGLFAIDNTKDLDSLEDASIDSPRGATKFEPATTSQIWKLEEDLRVDIDQMFQDMGVKSWDEVSKTMAATMINRLIKEKEARKTKYED